MKLGELFIALGFDVDDQKLKSFNDSIKSGWMGMLKLSAIAAGSVYAINKFVAGGVEAATALRNFNTETGHSIEGLQKWQIAATLTNASISADQVTASFKAMAGAISDVTMGKGNAGAFAMLGISDVRGMDVSDVMEELRQNFDKNVAQWGYSQTINLMKDVGFDAGMLQALKLSNDEFNKLAENKMLSPEAQEKLVALGDSISKFKLEFKLFKDQLSADWSPALIAALEKSIPIFKDFEMAIRAVIGAISDMFASLSPEDKAQLAAMAATLFILFNPVTSMFIALAAAIWDVGRALRGLESYSGKGLEWLMGFMPAGGSNWADNLKKSLASASSGMNLAPQGFLQSDFEKFYARNLSPANSREKEMAQMMANTQNNMSNVWNIQSNADALTLSELIMMRQKQMLDSAQAELGNGALR